MYNVDGSGISRSIVGRSGLALIRTNYERYGGITKLKGVRQFIGFVGYYRRFVKDSMQSWQTLVSLTRKGAPFLWGQDRTLLIHLKLVCDAPILGFPTGMTGLYWRTRYSDIGGVLSQILQEVVIAYARESPAFSEGIVPAP